LGTNAFWLFLFLNLDLHHDLFFVVPWVSGRE
jgi:hypothetical protein